MRFHQSFPSNRSDQDTLAVAAQYLAQEGFTSVMYRGESVWKKGMGVMAGPQYVKVACQNGQVTLEAWVRFAILPGVYVGELGITGGLAAIPKKLLRDRVRTLTLLLGQSPVPVS